MTSELLYLKPVSTILSGVAYVDYTYKSLAPRGIIGGNLLRQVQIKYVAK